MNGVFCALMLAGLAYAAAAGRLDAAQRALFSGGGEAVGLAVKLAGAYAFFGGLLGVLRESGAADALARAMEKPLSRLFRFAPGEEAALSDISLNLSANMLGVGGAAELRDQRGERDGFFHRVALSGRGGDPAGALCRPRGAAGLRGGRTGGGAAGLRKR